MLLKKIVFPSLFIVVLAAMILIAKSTVSQKYADILTNSLVIFVGICMVGLAYCFVKLGISFYKNVVTNKEN